MYYPSGGHANPALSKYDVVGDSPTTITVPSATATTTTTIMVERPRWSWCSTVWSTLVMCCCSCCLCGLFGFIGLLCSTFSYVDHKAGDYERAAYKRRCSWGWSMTGLALFLAVIVAVLIYWAVVGFVIQDTLYQLGKMD